MTKPSTSHTSSEPVSNSSGLAVPALTALVVGSMIGGGIFGLPSQMAQAAAPGPLLIGWLITGLGMLALALSFQALAKHFPKIDGGVYGYARGGFGNFMGFCAAVGYWIGAWIGVVAFLVLLGSSIGTFIPAFGQGNTPVAIIFASLVLWVGHFMVLRGVQEAAVVNVVVTIMKVVPLVVFIAAAVFFFDPNLIGADFWGTSTQVNVGKELQPLGGSGAQIVAMMLITVWVFSGVEGASIFSNRARRRADVGRATVFGFLFVLLLLIAVNLLSYGVLGQQELSRLPDPSLAFVFAHIVGPWGAKFVSIGLIISLLGVMLSWILLCTEILRIPSREGVLPAAVGRLNSHGTPATALWMSTVCIQVTLLLTLFSAKTYLFLILLASGTFLLPYLWVALFQFISSLRARAAGRQLSAYDIGIGLLAVINATWLVYAGKVYVLASLATYLILTPLYVHARREAGERQVFRPFEWIIFGILVLGSVAFTYLTVRGAIAF